ncbi:MAG: hypothetical protein IT357_06500 [Gemmatimonadaceae bacterium]|nr:hypothetical protein [Gemmatimonadaceae bacterium]
MGPYPACPSATLYSTQEDPIGLAGGLNLYGYGDGDPVNNSDPFGLCGIAGAAGSVVAGVGIAIATGGSYGVAALVADAGSGALCAGTLGKLKKLGSIIDAALDARRAVGPGRGAVHGTRVHRAMEKILSAADEATEVSYKNGDVVKRGTPGSIRIDAIEGSMDAPTAIYDLKTGAATLTERRIRLMRKHLPEASKDAPIVEVKSP